MVGFLASLLLSGADLHKSPASLLASYFSLGIPTRDFLPRICSLISMLHSHLPVAPIDEKR